MKTLRSLSRILGTLLLVTTLPLAAATIGAPAPGFELVDSTGKTHRLSDYAGKTVVLEWINHGCPFVVKHYDSGNMPALQQAAAGEGIVWFSVCSSAPGTQGHASPEEWARLNSQKKSAAAAVLIDEPGTVGRLYGARTTPHMYVIDGSGTLVYAGGIDSIPSADIADIARAENFVTAALADLRDGRAVANPSTKPYGCSVKYAD